MKYTALFFIILLNVSSASEVNFNELINNDTNVSEFVSNENQSFLGVESSIEPIEVSSGSEFACTYMIAYLKARSELNNACNAYGGHLDGSSIKSWKFKRKDYTGACVIGYAKFVQLWGICK